MSLKGIGLFADQVLVIISNGKTETIIDIEKHLNNSDVVEYLYEKYSELFFIPFDNSLYDNKPINKYFSNYSAYVTGNESRKYGIQNVNGGLPLLLELLMEKVETESIRWTDEE